MREKLRSLIFSEAGKYLIAGGLTTLLNLAVFNILLTAFPKMPHDAANAISIICAVLFAYVINSAYVFRKKVFLLLQFLKFLSARAASAAVELVSLHLFELFLSHFFSGLAPARGAKLITQVVVIVINYVFSKFFVFTDKKNTQKRRNKNGGMAQ